MKKLRLFVWGGRLWSCGPGMLLALAHNVEEARKLIRAKFAADLGVEKLSEKELCGVEKALAHEPDVFDKPVARYHFGSD